MKKDLTGQHFGRLTVIGDGGKNKKGRQYWRCRCTCGNETLVEESHLKAGHTKSCGCYRRERPRERSVDLTGQQFGRLTVIEPIKNANGSIKNGNASASAEKLRFAAVKICNQGRPGAVDVCEKRYGKIICVKRFILWKERVLNELLVRRHARIIRQDIEESIGGIAINGGHLLDFRERYIIWEAFLRMKRR